MGGENTIAGIIMRRACVQAWRETGMIDKIAIAVGMMVILLVCHSVAHAHPYPWLVWFGIGYVSHHMARRIVGRGKLNED